MAISSIITAPSAGGGGGGVTSLKAFGQADITGAAVLKAGSNASLSQSGQEITIAATVPAAGGAPPTIAGASAAGAAATFSRSDHNHGLTVGGATPSAGAITFTTGGTTGIVTSPSGNDVSFRIGVTGQAAGDLLVATSGTAWARRAKGNADELLAMDGAGSSPAYTGTPWLTALRVGLGGSTAANVFGTAAVQAAADTLGGEAFGAKADAATGARYALYSSAEAAAGHFWYDEANDRVELGSGGKAWRISSGAALPLQGEAGNANVGLCGTATFNSMVGGIALANGTTAPTTNSGTFAAIYNAAGTLHVYAGSTLDVKPGSTTTRFRVSTSVTAVASTNFSVGNLAPSVGGMAGGIFLGNATTFPATNPSAGVDVVSNAGVFTVKDPSGNLTYTASAAGAATASGLFLAASSGGPVTRELKKRSITINGVTINYLTDEV